jgi:hypothetical protein
MSASALYSREFFDGQMDGSSRSASVVVPLVLSLFPVASVVDVGCGVATWSSVFLANGVKDILAIDGDYVDRSQLRIPKNLFLPRDLTKPLRLDRRFDLCVSLEVAEHLPPSRAASFVADLVSMAPCVLFSAAAPGPTGTGHINAQFVPYWVDLFQQHGYEGVDAVRPKIWGNESVEWFYQQDIVMFAAKGHPVLNLGLPKPQSVIHPELYTQLLNAPPTLGVIKHLPKALLRSLRYRLGK